MTDTARSMELRHFLIPLVSPSERAMWPEIRETFRWLRCTEDELVYAARG